MLQTFFFFGCWNRDVADRSTVLQKLSAKQFEFGIIAGDNLYPIKNKENSSKTYYKNTLDRGAKLLNLARNEKNVGVAVGNHNVVDGVIAAEREIFTLYEAPATYVLMNGYNFIFINTNLCPYDIAKELEECLKRVDGLVYVVAHEPLVAAKEKDGKKFTVFDGAHAIVDVLFKHIAGGKQIAYLCADVHNFQTLVITRDKLFLPIIVSGTGGAEPDNIPAISMRCNLVQGLKVKPILSAMPYGYCLINGKNITYYTYNTVSSESSQRFGDWTVTIKREDAGTTEANLFTYNIPLTTLSKSKT